MLLKMRLTSSYTARTEERGNQVICVSDLHRFLLAEYFMCKCCYLMLFFSCTASGHHNAVCEDPDGGDAQDLPTSPPRVRFPRYLSNQSLLIVRLISGPVGRPPKKLIKACIKTETYLLRTKLYFIEFS